MKQKVVSDESDELRKRIAEMTNEMEKLKANQKDDSKSNSQTNKELDILKQKVY